MSEGFCRTCRRPEPVTDIQITQGWEINRLEKELAEAKAKIRKLQRALRTAKNKNLPLGT